MAFTLPADLPVNWDDGIGMSEDATYLNKVGAMLNALKAAILSVAGAPSEAFVATSENTALASYTDLATVTDTVTVTVGASGVARVSIFAQSTSSTSTGQCVMGFAVSGANTLAAADARSVVGTPGSSTRPQAFGYEFLLTGLTPGSTTFKAKYKAVSGVATFFNRRIRVTTNL